MGFSWRYYADSLRVSGLFKAEIASGADTFCAAMMPILDVHL
jgi:hypothetical protein